MEADEVYSRLSDRIASLESKVGDNASRFDALRSDLSDLKSSVIDMKSSSSGDLRGAMDKLTADIQRINDTLATTRSGVDEAKQAAVQKAKEVEDKGRVDLEAIRKKIEDDNDAAERKYQEQMGLFGKLGKQAEDAANMIGNFPDTFGKMATKAVDDGKKEILNQWEQSKKDILSVWEDSKNAITGSISNLTTPIIKEKLSEARDSIKKEIKDDLHNLIFEQVQAEKKEEPKLGPLATMDKDDLETMVDKMVKLAVANTHI